MQKKAISIVLCLAMLVSVFAFAVPVNAATVDSDPAGTIRIESADDFTWDNANVYFLLTDRFYNGNTSNDHSYGRTLDANGNPISGWNTAPATFHGGDFAGVTKKINEGYFDNLGVNAIWISAPYEQIHGYVDSGDDTNHIAHYSYHGYYVLDYTETDANFGTKAEFKTLVDTAHKHGIRVVMDIVMNHAGYNNIVDMETYNYGTITNRSAIDAYKYKLTDVAGFHSYIDYESSSSDWGRWWGPNWIRSGLPGYTDDGGGEMTASLAGLPDFRTESTNSVSVPQFLQSKWQKEGTLSAKNTKYGTSDTVSGFLTSWLADWVETYGVDGFRCDTAKHVEPASWKLLKTKCVAALKTWRQNNPTADGANWDEDFWMTGECWGHGVGKSDQYFVQGGFDSMINFEITGSLGANGGFPDASNINGLYARYAADINSDPNFNMLTYMSSHDTMIVRKDDNYYQGTALLLCPGAVQPFYGDETARPLVSSVPVEGGGHALRGDMNFGQNSDLLAHWQKVGKFRANHVAVGAGDHTLISNSNGLTFSRTYMDDDVTDGVICVMGASKNTGMAVDVSSIWANGKTVTNEYDGTTAVVTDGKATFNTGAQGVILISGPQPTISMSVKGPKYAFYDSQTVTVKLRGADYAMASIDGGTAFRVVDGQTFDIGDGIELGKVFNVTLTATNATETIEKSFSFKKKDPAAVTKVYFDNTSYGWDPINVYIYDENGSSVVENGAWPGKQMEYDSATGLYVYEVDDELTENGLVIFNNGSTQYPAQDGRGLAINDTNKIFLSGNRWVDYTDQTAEPITEPDPSTMRTVYFDNSTANYATPCIHVWKSSNNEAYKTWPGIRMTKVEGSSNLYQATFSAVYDSCVFSDNGGSQTGDISIPYQYAQYSNGNWKDVGDGVVTNPTTEPTKPTTPSSGPTKPTTPSSNPTQPTTSPVPDPDKILLGDVNLDGKITIKDVTLLQRACAELATLSEDAQIAADVNQDGNVTVKDATSIQAYIAEMTMGGAHTGKYVDKKTTPEPENAVILDASELALGNEHWFAWTWNNDTDGVWVKGTGSNASAISFNADDLKTNILFARVNAQKVNPVWDEDDNIWNQTNDLTVQAGKTYKLTGWESSVMLGEWMDSTDTPTTPTTPTDPTDPNPENTVYMVATGYDDAGQEYYAWTWNNDSDGIWVKGTGAASRVTFSGVKSNIIFVRMDPANNGNPGWSYVWNQSKDHTTQVGGTFTISSWFDGDWSGSTPVTNPTNPTTPTNPSDDTIYMVATGYDDAGQEYYAWTWNNDSDGIWVKGTGAASRVTFSGVKSNVVFVRMDPANNGNPGWDYAWNQSADHITKLGGTFVINSWFDGDWQ